MEQSDNHRRALRSDLSEPGIGMVLGPISAARVHPAAGLNRKPYFCYRTSAESCPLRSTSRNAGSHRQRRWPPRCHLVTWPEPGCETCARSSRPLGSLMDISRWSAGSVSNHDRRSARGDAGTIESRRPASK